MPPTCARPIGQACSTAAPFPFPLDYLPSGLFDNSTLEHYLRHNIERRAHAERLQRALPGAQGVELYIVAMNLDTAERVVFGHDEDSSLTISEAVQASTALPGFYKPGAHHAASTTSTAACGARPTSTSPSSTAPTSSSATTRSGRSRTASSGKYDPQKDDYVRRGRAARRPAAC